MTLTESEVRTINLIEVLQEEAEDEGREVPEPPAEARTWSEQQIRAFFMTGGSAEPAMVKAVPPAADDLAARFPPPDDATFSRWFPGLGLSRTACNKPRLRVLCFPNAGNAEDMYTLEGTGVRRAASPLLEWCRANGAECLAVQPPGRNMRNKERPFTTCDALVAALLPAVASRLLEAPYVVIAHSVGTWNAYEFLRLAQRQGLPMPAMAFLSDIPWGERPWRQQRGLDEEQFKEECRGWDVNELVFSAALWDTYQPLMRADITLFDEYEHRHAAAPPLPLPGDSLLGQPRPAYQAAHGAGLEPIHPGDLPAAGGRGAPPVATGQGQQGRLAASRRRPAGGAGDTTGRPAGGAGPLNQRWWLRCSA